MNALLAIARFVTSEAGEEARINTHSSWWPETYEIYAGGLASLIVFGALFKFVLPQMRKALTARSEGIAKELVQAHNNKQSAIASAAIIREDKGDISAERTRLLAEADQEAARVLAEGRARIAADAAAAEAKGLADIETGKGRLNAEVQGQVASLASAATEHVVMGSLDTATHQRLIEDFISKVGAR
jgi:F-type H+-transporting ATPase subunit b